MSRNDEHLHSDALRNRIASGSHLILHGSAFCNMHSFYILAPFYFSVAALQYFILWDSMNCTLWYVAVYSFYPPHALLFSLVSRTTLEQGTVLRARYSSSKFLSDTEPARNWLLTRMGVIRAAETRWRSYPYSLPILVAPS